MPKASSSPADRRARPATGGGPRWPSWGLIDAVERRLMHRVRPRRSRETDRLMVALSRAGEHSTLWLAIAAAMAAAGGTRGRRAAGNGLLAIAGTSPTVHLLKLVLGRRRPAPRRRLYRRPRTLSFPSGHSGSAFAFSVAASREVPEAGPVLLPLAAMVAYSRTYLGVHYPSDVLAGAAIGTAYGMSARSTSRKLGSRIRAERRRRQAPPVTEAVLVVSPRSGNSSKLGRARRALDRQHIQVVEELDIEQLDRLPELLRSPAGGPRLVIAAGGDGTVGSVAARLAGRENVLGVLPLGTGNDFARALDIPLGPRDAAELLAVGEVSNVDLGRVTRDGQPPAYFVHAATSGLNVDFSKLATRASVRDRIGRVTYLVAAVYALREHTAFRCTLGRDGVADELDLVQLSVISAPVIGGSLGLNVKGPYPQDHKLDVLAVEDAPPWKVLRAGLLLLMGVDRSGDGVRSMHVDTLEVGSPDTLGLALDGELHGSLPGRFNCLPGALRVITPARTGQSAAAR